MVILKNITKTSDTISADYFPEEKESEEKKAYKAFQDRVAMPGKPRKLTEEEIKKIKKEGRI